MSYVIPTGELSLASQVKMRVIAEEAGKQMLYNRKIVTPPPVPSAQNPNPQETAEARDADYAVDFTPVATRVTTGWLSMPLAVAGNRYSVFADITPAALTPQVPNNACWVFYGVTIIDTTQAIDEMYFAVGNGPTPKANFDLEKLFSKMETDGFFSIPVVFVPQDIVTCTVKARLVTGVGFRVALKTLIVEPLQVTNA